MNTKTENDTSKFDMVKWGIVIILLVAGIVGNIYFAAQPVPLRLAGWVVLLCIIGVIGFQTAAGRKIWGFAEDSRGELRKVFWPTRQETIKTTGLVIGMVVIAALFLWLVDSTLLMAVSFLTGQRG